MNYLGLSMRPCSMVEAACWIQAREVDAGRPCDDEVVWLTDGTAVRAEAFCKPLSDITPGDMETRWYIIGEGAEKAAEMTRGRR